MTAQILDGKATAAAIKSDLTARVAALKEKGVTPGRDARSATTPAARSTSRASTATAPRSVSPPSSVNCPRPPRRKIEAVVRELNEDPTCTGYIVQLPLPKGIDENRILELMDPDKDADGLHPMNLGWLVLDELAPLPCTPNGVLTLLRRYGVEIKGAEVVVVGRGVTIGRPMPLLLTRRSENATVTQCHTGTRDLRAPEARRHHRRRGRVRPPHPRRGREAGCRRPRRRCLAQRRGQDRRRRPPGRRRGRRVDLPEPRRRGPDDPRPAAGQRGGSGGAQCRLTAAPRTQRPATSTPTPAPTPAPTRTPAPTPSRWTGSRVRERRVGRAEGGEG